MLLSCNVFLPLGGVSFACKRWASAAMPQYLYSSTMLSGVTSLQAIIRSQNLATAESTKQRSKAELLSEKINLQSWLFFFFSINSSPWWRPITFTLPRLLRWFKNVKNTIFHRDNKCEMNINVKGYLFPVENTRLQCVDVSTKSPAALRTHMPTQLISQRCCGARLSGGWFAFRSFNLLPFCKIDPAATS